MGNVISRRRALVALCSFVGKCHTHMHTLVGPDLGRVMSRMYEQSSEHRDMHAFYPSGGARSPFGSEVPERENRVSKERASWLFPTHSARGLENTIALNGTKRHLPFPSSFASNA